MQNKTLFMVNNDVSVNEVAPFTFELQDGCVNMEETFSCLGSFRNWIVW